MKKKGFILSLKNRKGIEMLYKSGIKSDIKILNPSKEEKKVCIKCSKCGNVNCGVKITKCSKCGASL